MRIVTVSRLVGSFGDEVASILAENTDLELLGRNALHQMAQDCDPDYYDACTAYENEHGPGFFERLFIDRPSYKSLFEALTLEQASKGNIVIVGRGAQIVLHGFPGVFSVRVEAPFETRVSRIMQRLNCTRGGAAEHVLRYDQERDKLVRLVFDRDPRDPSLYDLMINTAHFGAGAAADVIGLAVEKSDRVDDIPKLQELLKNMSIAKRIETHIRKKMTSAAVRYVEIEVNSFSVAKINGRIADKGDKATVEKMVKEYPGITRVDNNLVVTDLSYGI